MSASAAIPCTLTFYKIIKFMDTKILTLIALLFCVRLTAADTPEEAIRGFFYAMMMADKEAASQNSIIVDGMEFIWNHPKPDPARAKMVKDHIDKMEFRDATDEEISKMSTFEPLDVDASEIRNLIKIPDGPVVVTVYKTEDGWKIDPRPILDQ